MKTAKSILSLVLCIVLMFSIGIVAFADTPAAPEVNASQAQTQIEAAESTDSGESVQGELPTVIDMTPDDEDVAASPDVQQAEQQEQPAAEKSSNTPYLVGAVLAVILFIGVAVFCKFKGNR